MKALLKKCFKPVDVDAQPAHVPEFQEAAEMRANGLAGTTRPLGPMPESEVEMRVKNSNKFVKSKNAKKVYTFGEEIGSGGFASVVSAKHKGTGEEFACKIVKLPGENEEHAPDEMSRKDVLREIEIASLLNHDNIVRLKEFYLHKHKAYLIMEKMKGGSLIQMLLKSGAFCEADAKLLFGEMLQGLSYLHRKNVIHRDVKLENILLAHPNDLRSVRLTDFGLSKVCQNVTGTRVGTPQYAAPDIVYRKGDKKYGKSVDMWAAGVALYVLLACKQPFWDPDENVMFSRILNCDYNFDDSVWESISESAKDLIAKLLVCDSEARLTAEQALQHEWLHSKG